MDDTKVHPPPGATGERVSKKTSANRPPSLPQPYDRRQLGDDGSRSFEAALVRDYEYFRLNPLVDVVNASFPLAHAFLANNEIQLQLAGVDQQLRYEERNGETT